jgi:diguanylate cyclase
MPQNVSIQLSETWKSICEKYSALDHHLTLELITKNLDAFVAAFYKQMLVEPESAEYFSDNIIQKRLIDTLKAWLLETFNVALNGQYENAVIRQQKVGNVHARVGIPSWLIMRGVREIERTMFEYIASDSSTNYMNVVSYVVQLLGFSTEIMCRTYEDKTAKNHEVKHSYRLFSAMQDVAVH